MNEHVLVLDDEPSILEILGQYLLDEGYQCDVTTSPLQALEWMKSESFELLITDLKMPEMQGNEVLRRAKEHDPDLAVIVVTALLETTNAIESLRAGADDYLLKPFNLNEISFSVSRVLERRRLLLENRRHQQELEVSVREATANVEMANRELRETKEYLENLLQSSVDGIVTMDREARISFANMGAVGMFGYLASELVGSSPERLLIGGADELRHIRYLLSRDQLLQNYETEFRHKNGHVVPVNVSLTLVRGHNGEIVSTLAICKDITRQKKLEAELKEMSIKDSLTELYNQRYFYDRLEGEIERARRQGHPLSLLLFDVDHFKTYNDCHGHLEGDSVLRAIGRIVFECTREHVDIGFRYGGDEFTVILPEAGETQALNIAERIRARFEGQHFDKLTLSIGLMSYTEGSSAKSFIRLADMMMYDAKRSGGNRVYVFKADTEAAKES